MAKLEHCYNLEVGDDVYIGMAAGQCYLCWHRIGRPSHAWPRVTMVSSNHTIANVVLDSVHPNRP